MSKRKTASLILICVWLIYGIGLLISIFAFGSNVEARFVITRLLYIYLCLMPIFAIAQAVIRRKYVILSVVLGLLVFAFLFWLLFIRMPGAL